MRAPKGAQFVSSLDLENVSETIPIFLFLPGAFYLCLRPESDPKSSFLFLGRGSKKQVDVEPFLWISIGIVLALAGQLLSITTQEPDVERGYALLPIQNTDTP